MIVYKPTYQDKRTGETRETEHYYFRHRGKRYPTHLTDKRAAERKARDMIAQMELGYDPKKQELSRTESVAALIDAYTGQLQAGPKQQYQVGLRLTKLTDALKVKTLGEFTGEKVNNWITKSALARRTQAHYRVAVRAFGGWLAKQGFTPRNPFADLEQVRHIEADRKLERRALSPEEFELLVTATEKSPRRYCKLTGRQRAMVYRFIALSGLRRAEVASLRPSSFRLDAEPPHVVVEAGYTKNRKLAVQPLPPSIVEPLRAYLRGLPQHEAVWPINGKMTSRMVKEDLEEAGIPVLVAGKQFDFHSLRGQYATCLARAGVGLVSAQKLLRHSTPTLTANVYTHLGLEDLGREVEKLG